MQKQEFLYFLSVERNFVFFIMHLPIFAEGKQRKNILDTRMLTKLNFDFGPGI